jgi:predicted P-loop ATPase
LRDYLGCPDTAYVRAVSANFPIGAIARIRQPGCQCDAFPVLEGFQGVGKSTAARTLYEPWFSDEVNDLGSKDASMQVSGVWCIEISELDAMSRNEISKVKAFISRRVDRFRPPYGRRVIEHPRDCIFMGTTNATGYLRDETGSRRILPVVCGQVDLDGLFAVRDQIFAEADCKFQQGAKWWIADPALKLAAQDEQAARYIGDPWTDAVVAYISQVGESSITEILQVELCVPIDRQDQVAMNRVSRILISNGYERYQKRDGDRRTWLYRKIEPEKSAQPKLAIVK